MRRIWMRFLSLAAALAVMASALPISLAAVEDTGFTDVAADAWYAEAVMYVRDRGIMNGTTETTFSPDDTLTRGQLAAILYRTEGSPAVTVPAPFPDVSPESYYADAAAWASDNGIIGGYQDGRFGGGDPVTQQQMIAILWRHAGRPEAEGAQDEGVSAYAQTAVRWARANGMIGNENDGGFLPPSSAPRALVAATLRNFLLLRETEQETGETPKATQASETASDGQKILIAYFAVAENSDVDAISSASVLTDNGEARGLSRYLADIIAERTSGTLFSIRTEEAYPGVYNDLADYAKQEQDEDARPVLASHIEDFDSYDVVFVGYPIWWYTLPMVMNSFFDEYDFTGKTIIPFCTHYGSQSGGTFARIAELEPNADVKEGFYVHHNDTPNAREDVLRWMEGLGY